MNYRLTVEGFDLLRKHNFPTPRCVIGMYVDQWVNWGEKQNQQYHDAFAKIVNPDEMCLFQLLE